MRNQSPFRYWIVRVSTENHDDNYSWDEEYILREKIEAFKFTLIRDT